MIWYFVAISLHILAAILWIGHMTYWTMFAEPITKRFGPPEAGQLLGEISERLDWLGWPCLTIALATGIFLLYYQGVSLEEVRLGRVFVDRFGKALGAKLLLVSVMVTLQFFFDRKRKMVGWLLVLVGITIIPLSALLVR